MPACWELNQAIEMSSTEVERHAKSVQDMFARIAGRYELMNRLMTAGQDKHWRKEVIHRSNLKRNGYLLDLGAGTGDLAREALNQVPTCRTVAADFTPEMMRVGKTRDQSQRIDWVIADALSIPFGGETFEAVVSGFLLRNVTDIHQALQEQLRVLKTGGYIVVLDTTRPAQNHLRKLIDYYLNVIIPDLGRVITGDGSAYAYLSATTQDFLKAEQLAAYVEQSGFQEVAYRKLMFGTIAIHWGRK
jgi:demethylmenaquinone methyltransferase/2-methoxy-6-polyprenyl-1,4-benzoquinol methylase